MTYNNETYIPTDGLVASYDLDGNAVDTAGGNNGTATNVTWVGADRGYVKETASFNGTSSYIDLGTLGQTNTSFTIIANINISDKTAIRKIYQTSNTGKGFYINTDGQIYFFRYYTTLFDQISTGIDVADGKWHQVVGVYDGIDLKIYLDGILKNTISVTSTTFMVSAHNTYIGRAGVSGQYWNGKIGLVKEYNRALSQDEINNLYDEGLRRLGPTNINYSTPTDGLVASYDAEDITLDTSGNGNNGTNNNVVERTIGTQVVGEYNGVSSYINSGFNTNPGTSDFSCGIWAKFTDTTTKVLLSKGPNASSGATGGYISLLTYNDGKVGFRVSDNTTMIEPKSTGAFNDGKWHYIEGVRSGSDYSLYIDNQLIQTLSGTIYNITVTSNWVVGNFSYLNGSLYYGGEAGLLKIYNKALSQEEITALYHEGLTKLSFPKYSLDNLEEGKVLEISRPISSGTYYDQTGNGNNGTNSGVVDSSNGLYNIMTFDGGTDKITYASPVIPEGGNRIAFTVKPASITGTDIIISNLSNSLTQFGCNVYLSNGVINFQCGKGGGGSANFNISGSLLSIGKTYRIITQWDGTTNVNGVKIYVDGILDAQGTALSATSGTPVENLTIGDLATTGTLPFHGDLSNIEIGSTIFTEQEIQQDYYSSKLI